VVSKEKQRKKGAHDRGGDPASRRLRFVCFFQKCLRRREKALSERREICIIHPSESRPPERRNHGKKTIDDPTSSEIVSSIPSGHDITPKRMREKGEPKKKRKILTLAGVIRKEEQQG